MIQHYNIKRKGEIVIITYSKETEIHDQAKVKVTKMGNIVEVQYMARRNTKQTIQRIDETSYLVCGTGEVKQYENKSENRSQNINSLRKTFRKLRGVINSNFEGLANELHIILTYKENMQDTERFYKDMQKFIRQLRNELGREIKYILVVEPQARGAWHSHLLVSALDNKNLFLDNNRVREMWGHGIIVKTKSLKGIDNIGAYLSAYLSDIELEEGQSVNAGEEVLEKIIDGVPKKVIKGGRLHFYPPGMNLYRTSRNIDRPREYMTTYEEAKSANGLATPVYTQKIEVDKEDFKNVIQYEQYNTRRKTK